MDIFFILVAIICIVGAIGALESKEIVYGGIFLGIFLVGIAEAYILLGGTVIGLFQIVVYVGAVAILILFTIFLVERDPEEGEVEPFDDGSRKTEKIIGLITACTVFLVFTYLITLIGTSNLVIDSISETNLLTLTTSLFEDYGVVMILLPIVLVTSLIGSLMLMSFDPGSYSDEKEVVKEDPSSNSEKKGDDLK